MSNMCTDGIQLNRVLNDAFNKVSRYIAGLQEPDIQEEYAAQGPLGSSSGSGTLPFQSLGPMPYQQAPPVQASQTIDRSRVNSGPFAWTDVFGEINPHILAGETTLGSRPRPDIQSTYSTRPYGHLNMVRQEQGGKYKLQLFRRINGIDPVVRLSKQGRSHTLLHTLCPSASRTTLRLTL
jgi:hypothetical protein